MRGANNLLLRNAFVEWTGAPLPSSLLFVEFRLWIEIRYSVLAVCKTSEIVCPPGNIGIYYMVNRNRGQSLLYIRITVPRNRFLLNNQPDALIIQINSVPS
jgi:hypothetical protein